MFEPWFGMSHYQFLRLLLESVGFVTVCYWMARAVLSIASTIERLYPEPPRLSRRPRDFTYEQWIAEWERTHPGTLDDLSD